MGVYQQVGNRLNDPTVDLSQTQHINPVSNVGPAGHVPSPHKKKNNKKYPNNLQNMVPQNIRNAKGTVGVRNEGVNNFDAGTFKGASDI